MPITIGGNARRAGGVGPATGIAVGGGNRVAPPLPNRFGRTDGGGGGGGVIPPIGGGGGGDIPPPPPPIPELFPVPSPRVGRAPGPINFDFLGLGDSLEFGRQDNQFLGQAGSLLSQLQDRAGRSPVTDIFRRQAEQLARGSSQQRIQDLASQLGGTSSPAFAALASRQAGQLPASIAAASAGVEGQERARQEALLSQAAGLSGQIGTALSGQDLQAQALALQQRLGEGGIDVQQQSLRLQQLLGLGGINLQRQRTQGEFDFRSFEDLLKQIELLGLPGSGPLPPSAQT